MKRLAPLLAPVLLAALALQGCKRKPNVPPELTYLLRAKDLSLVGATVVVGGKRTTFKRQPWNAQGDIAAAEVSLPRTGPSALTDMKVELATPCGMKTIGLKGDVTPQREDESRGRDPSLYVMVTGDAAPPAGMDVWMDARGHKVRVGEATFTEEQGRLYDAACKAESPVFVDAEQVGTLDAKSAAGKSLFVSGRKGVCYSFESVAYGGSAKSYRTVLRGAQVHLINEGKIEYFLKKAPDSLQVRPSAGSAYRTELVEMPCP